MANRRTFLRNLSGAATSAILLSAAGIGKGNKASAAIGCAPGMAAAGNDTMQSVKSGLWSDPKTWNTGRIPLATDTPLIQPSHSVIFDMISTTVSGVLVTGTLEFHAAKSTTLLTNANVVVTGKLIMQPNNAGVTQILRFIEIDESNFAGSSMTVLDSDVGLWVMDKGRLNIIGTQKTSWTCATTGVSKGATSFTVLDATGWLAGDEVMIVPTDKPGFYTQDWNDSTMSLVDSFFVKFETRVITKISGNCVSFADALRYDHMDVSSCTKTWYPEVANLTRNTRIAGTKDPGDSCFTYRRSHIFICASVPQVIKYMAGKYLGPRKMQGARRPLAITGRYGIHFHHCNDGSVGSVVEGCVLNDIGTRCYVPHVSNGIKMINNVAFNSLEEAFWYDWQSISHSVLWEHNLLCAVRLNGTSNSCTGMALGQGDGNIARNNVAVYANGGVEHNGGGAFSWLTDSEGVWVFENNMSHSCVTGIFVWQNSSHNHTVENYSSYNCNEGISHGAYGNCYIYNNGHHYNSKIFVEAVSGNTYGIVFKDILCDAAGNTYCVRAVDSPIPSNPTATNKFIHCTFRNYSKAPLQLASAMLDSNPEKQYKMIDLINCNFPGGPGFVMDDSDQYPLKDNNRVRVQSITGECTQAFKSGGRAATSKMAVFAPSLWGTGKGLKGEYYNGSNFDKLAFTRTDSMIMFQQWTYDIALSPNGVHHLITGDQYSMRWTGSVMAQYTEAYTFLMQGSGGHRLYINGKLILDSWAEKPDNATFVKSSPINLVKGQKYNIKLEHFNRDGKRGCILHWQCLSLGVVSNVPQCQLYTTNANAIDATAPTAEASAFATEAKPPVDHNQAQFFDAKAYPSPFTSSCRVELNSSETAPATISIYDVKGTRVALYSDVMGNSTTTVGDNLARGMYFINIIQNNRKKTLPVVKM